MNYPIEEIAYKMKFIMDKLDNGEELTPDEDMYTKKIMRFKSVYDAICLERQLKDVNLEHSKIIKYLVERKTRLLKTIKVTRSRNKLEQMQAQVNNIEEFISSGAVEYFKDFLIDHNDLDHVDIKQLFDSMAAKDTYLNCTRLEKDHVPYQETPFIYENRYTKEITFNRPVIELVRIILAGDFKIYNALEKRDRLLKNKGDNIEDVEALNASIPEEFRSVKTGDLSRIMYYGRGRIGEKDDHTFDNFRDDLDILSATARALNGEVSQGDDQVINDSIVKILEGIIAGTHKVEDFTNYEILKYFDCETDTTKFREILIKNRFDLEAIKKSLLQDDLLSNTNLYSAENLFVDRNGELCLDNLSLASSIMNAEEINEDECLSADPKCLNRIKYYQPAYRQNPHDYERDKYDVKILVSIARYRQAKKLQQEQEIVDKNNKSLL